MKLTVEFPSVSYREGPEAVRRFARAVEQIGYDHIDVFDHVVMGHPMAPGSRPAASAARRMASMATRALVASVIRVASQPSPSSPTRRHARSDIPPIQTGRARPWGGFGSMAIASMG